MTNRITMYFVGPTAESAAVGRAERRLKWARMYAREEGDKVYALAVEVNPNELEEVPDE